MDSARGIWGGFGHLCRLWLDRWLALKMKGKSMFVPKIDSTAIYPSAAGTLFVAALIAFLIFGINAENNLIIGLSAWLFSIFVTVMVYSYRNISGISIEPVESENRYVGQTARFRLRIASERKRWSITCRADAEGFIPEFMPVLDGHGEIGVSCLLTRRGRAAPGIISLESTFPLGLFRSRAAVDFRQSCLAYPRPEAGECVLRSGGTPGEGNERISGHVKGAGMDGLAGLRPDRTGEPLSFISWKHVAQGRGYYSKDFSEDSTETPVIEVFSYPADRETCLSVACHGVLMLTDAGRTFGVDFGGSVIGPGSGREHMERILERMALIP